MTATGSPSRASVIFDRETSDGRRCRVTPYDESVHTPGTAHTAWDPYPDQFPAGPFTEVIEYAPAGHEAPIVTNTTAPRRLTEEEVQELPEFLRPHTTAEPEPVSETLVPKVRRAPSGKPSKFQYLEALRDAHDLTHAEFHLLTVLLTYADADLSNGRPGHARLAAHMGYGGGDPRQVRKLLDSLERKGYVEVQEPGTNTGSRRAATYRLVLPIREE
ncbi:hypothetical protein I8D64_13990 [Brachybacterium sp. MASK1Z-5]|uniref:Helix-turn-helix domain-containing protein n=1 Tax=Brachybacterium halotolerans TaxID=2795215 RepID=A0ABS1BCY1_9MICO|nr:hypothetical protein [Brachybacterium halotolerans]MBK0332507.1 hypothetical protein [Brachybacterium halotolerans]